MQLLLSLLLLFAFSALAQNTDKRENPKDAKDEILEDSERDEVLDNKGNLFERIESRIDQHEDKLESPKKLPSPQKKRP